VVEALSIGQKRLRKSGSVVLLVAALFFLLNVALLPPPMDAWFWGVFRLALIASVIAGGLAIWIYPRTDARSKYEAKIVTSVYSVGLVLFLLLNFVNKPY
jgi:hypothetical protein